MDTNMDASRPAQATNALGVLAVFLKLGLTSFGGPVAHIGYFRREFVERRRWLDDATFTDLVGLCQFLPGPASSQVGFSIGLLRAGWLGGLAAWCGFTLPSVVLLIAFAMLAPTLGGPLGDGLIHSSPVSSNHCSRDQPESGTTVSSALIFRSALNRRASSPMVMP